MKRTALYNWHKSHGARMVEFAGWEMPLQYTSIRAEHQRVRERAGLFDLSHMGRIRIRGRDRFKFVQYIFTNDLKDISEGGVHYGFLCNRHGGVIDDVTVYLAPDYIMLVVNACNSAIVLNWLRQCVANYDVEIEDSSVSILMLAIQGPRSLEILNSVANGDFSALKTYQFTVRYLYRAKAVVSRTGYTGEDGFEIYCGSIYLQPLWERLLDEGEDRGLRPVGLGARDTLRTEACYPLYGNELDTQTTPLEAGLGKFVKFSKPDFIGKTALLHSKDAEFSKRLICFEMLDNAIPRKGYTVSFEGVPIGTVTSGTFSPTFKKGIGMAYVDKVKAKVGTDISIKVHDKFHPAIIRPRPIYKRRK